MEVIRPAQLTEHISVCEEETQALFTRMGQILSAQVIEKVTNNRFFLKFGKHLLLAETLIPLTPGEKIKVRVESLKPKVLLKLLPQVPLTDITKTFELKEISALFKWILSSQEGNILFNNIKKTLQVFLADKEKFKKSSFWRILAGICLAEKHEKSILEKLILTFLSTSKNQEERQIMVSLLHQLEFIRKLNQHLRENGFYLRWPFQWNGEYKDLEVFLGHSFFHFRLELEQLKKIEGIIKLSGKRKILLDFIVENEKIAQFIKENISKLYKTLESLGFKIEKFHCRVVDREYWEKEFWTNWVQFMNLVDIKV